jgi:lipoyl(octanoyl) transferase
MAREMLVARLGRTQYAEALQLQRRLQAERIAGELPDLLLLTEHEHVLTLGRNANEANLLVSKAELESRGIPLIRTERGGEITYHGPGQLIAYPIFDLRAAGLSVHRYIEVLEQSAIDLLASIGVPAERRPGSPGVWCRGSKIASVGAYVAHWVTMHGIAINVNPDLSYFDLIVPCGLAGVKMTSIDELGQGQGDSSIDLTEAYEELFERIFGVRLKPAPHSLTETAAALHPTPPAARAPA